MAELVYALVLGTNAARLEGSSPSLPTRENKLLYFREGIERFFLIFIYKNEKIPGYVIAESLPHKINIKIPLNKGIFMF